MKLLLKSDVIGVNRSTNETRLHAKSGDVLFVLLQKFDEEGKLPKYYTCDSLYFPDNEAIVFPSQVEKIIEEHEIHSDEEADTNNDWVIPRTIAAGTLEQIEKWLSDSGTGLGN